MEHQQTEINKALFSAWVSDPSGIGNAGSGELELLAREYPYCQISQSLIAKKAHGLPGSDSLSSLARAALCTPDRKVLFNLIHHPERLQEVNGLTPSISDNFYEVAPDDYYPLAEATQPEPDDETIPVDTPEQLAESGSDSIEDSDEAAERDEEEKMLLGNIASSDFFAFQNRVTQSETPEEPIEHAQGPENIEGNDLESSQEVARYDDDSMPYSFLWWLHKTRKEHADTYQPFADFKLDITQKITKKSGVQLNQQIIENIFHLQSPLADLEDKAPPQTVHFEVKRKEEEIIEKFIREDPQIHPPSPDKLDMENKARKSAEDPNDLVSETLAAIYTEQMLFHKAIDTYQKLSLKFPEKRAYFADQISELEKKIN